MTVGWSPIAATKTAGHWLHNWTRSLNVSVLPHWPGSCSKLQQAMARRKKVVVAGQVLLACLTLVLILHLRCARDPDLFHALMTPEQHEVLMDALNEFSMALQEAGIPFFMYGGTLLGSWRHHGLIPWDDDVDVILPYASRDRLKAVLEQRKPRYILNTNQTARWKFYSHLATPIADETHSSPFVDICFYNLTGKYVWDADPYFANKYIYPLGLVFPLTMRPFGSLQLPAPRDTRAVLSTTYNLDLCMLRSYSHLEEKDVRKCSKVPCKELQHRVAFVEREVEDEKCEEYLVLNGTTISRVSLDFTVGCV